MGNHAEILRRWQLLSSYLNRRQRSLWAGAEAEAIGYGGCVLLSGVHPDDDDRHRTEERKPGLAHVRRNRREPGNPALPLWALPYNFKPVGSQFQNYGLGNVRALFRLNPSVVQIWTAVAFGVFDKRFVDSAYDHVFRCCGRHFASCFAVGHTTACAGRRRGTYRGIAPRPSRTAA